MTTIKKDALRNKMDQHVIDNIEKFIKPASRDNDDAKRWARDWLEQGVALYEVNCRLEEMEHEAMQTIVEEEQAAQEAEDEPKKPTKQDGYDTFYLHF